MTTFAIKAGFDFVLNANGEVRTWDKKNSAQKFKSSKNIVGEVVPYTVVEQGAPIAPTFISRIIPHYYAATKSMFAAMFETAGGNQPRMMYKAQKAVAAAWTGTREEFVAQSLAYGIIRRTTVINWKEGRA